MKKILFLGCACFLCACMSNAETVSGSVVKAKKNMLSLKKIMLQWEEIEKDIYIYLQSYS